jgi:hypothetical protein
MEVDSDQISSSDSELEKEEVKKAAAPLTKSTKMLKSAMGLTEMIQEGARSQSRMTA